jgi:quinoprotein glucose dehydrogenase
MPWILTMVKASTAEDKDQPISGETLYARLCAVCHGSDLRGDSQKTYPSLINIEQKMNAQQIIDQMSLGRGLMPSFGFLTETEKRLLADYLMSGGTKSTLSSKKEMPHAPENAQGREPYSHTGYNRFLDPEGYPAIRPPWGTLNAIDLKGGRIVWQVALGEFEDLKARGLSPTGTENYGGPVVTAGGLVWIGATKDETLKAFDKSTGALLWKGQLPAGGYATPAVYSVDGRAHVVIACGGGKMGTRSGDAYVAFALPEAPGSLEESAN